MGRVSEPVVRPRLSRRVRYVAACVVLLALVGYFAVQYDSNSGGAPRCTVVAADGGGPDAPSYSFTPEQAANAATIAVVGTAKRMPERAVTIALATALQESALRNIRHGDRDSLGLFQQRPSQGWGKPEQIMDPTYAAGIFYDRLAEVPGYSRLPLTVAAQRVQRSGFPQAYAKHEPDARLLSAALTGRSPGSLSCSGPRGVTAGDPAKVRTELVRAFGKEAVAATGGSAGESARAAGWEITVVPGASAERGGHTFEERGWAVAHWAVARASVLHVERVSFGGRVWQAGKNQGRWKTGAPAGPPAGDRVRITVAAGD
ncbi:hypothetical protein [Streptomyces sp. NPDC006879]|uniref:hypothetical protein n=1 Tax=Streptomyces sp. NPDC006879 TaxID=3364767 RepID=UPI003694970F